MNRIHLTSTSETILHIPNPTALIHHRHQPWWRQILDPGSNFVNKWNHIFLFSCLSALFVDPLYFLIPEIRKENSCLSNNYELAAIITIWRSILDLFSFLHSAMKFRSAYVAPSSRVFGRGDLVYDPKMIALRYLKTDFTIHLTAALPLPQIFIWFIIPAVRSPSAAHANPNISLIIILQYIPCILAIFPLNQRIIKNTGFWSFMVCAVWKAECSKEQNGTHSPS